MKKKKNLYIKDKKYQVNTRFSFSGIQYLNFLSELFDMSISDTLRYCVVYTYGQFEEEIKNKL